MQVKISFSGREHTPALDTYIRERLEKIERFLADERPPVFIDIVVEFHPMHQHHRVVARVKTAQYDCLAEHEGPDEFMQINEVFDRLYKQLKTEKERHIDRRKHGCDKECRAELNQNLGDENEGYEE